MAMLAEPRKKSKFRLQPYAGFNKINKRCDGDTSSFGYKIMANMGWAPGKGLGLNESGDIDPIKLRLKNDDAGLGFKVSEDDAVAQQSEFQALLLQLNSVASDEPMKESRIPKIKSLEKQSEQSTVRVHYKKFTRGKDLSRASEQDLKSILGLPSINPKANDPEQEELELKVPDPVEDASDGCNTNMYVTAGSSVDYFKRKYRKKMKENQDTTVKEENLTKDHDNKRRSVTWGDVDVSYVDKYIKDMVDTSGSVDESLIDGECIEEPPAKKKKKKKHQHCPVKVSEDNVDESAHVNTEKKKKKKRKLDEETYKGNVTENQEDHTVIKKKKQKLNLAEQDEEVSEANIIVDKTDTEALCPREEINCNVDLDEVPKKKKKKKKKKKNQVSALPDQTE